MPQEFTDLIKQYVRQERNWGELDSLVISPDLEQFIRKIVREELDELVKQLRFRYFNHNLETK